VLCCVIDLLCIARLVQSERNHSNHTVYYT
jgi:hypothetical protein